MSRNRVKSAPKQGRHTSRRTKRIFRFNKVFKTLNLFPGGLSYMRGSLNSLIAGGAAASNQSWMLNFLKSANRTATKRFASPAKSQRLRNWATNLVDYQPLEARNLLAADFGFTAATSSALESTDDGPQFVITNGPTIQDNYVFVDFAPGTAVASDDTLNAAPIKIDSGTPDGTYALKDLPGFIEFLGYI